MYHSNLVNLYNSDGGINKIGIMAALKNDNIVFLESNPSKSLSKYILVAGTVSYAAMAYFGPAVGSYINSVLYSALKSVLLVSPKIAAVSAVAVTGGLFLYAKKNARPYNDQVNLKSERVTAGCDPNRMTSY